MAEEPHTMLATILSGTERMLNFAAQAGTRKLLLTSSGAVYGPQPASLSHVTEEYTGAPDPLLPGSVYGEGKRAAELMCSLATRGSLEVKIARCFAFLGPHLPLDTHFAAGNFLRDGLAGRTIEIASDGRTVRFFRQRNVRGRPRRVALDHAVSRALDAGLQRRVRRGSQRA